MSGTQKSSLGLRIIAIGKLLKVAMLLTVGIFALTLASGGATPETFRHWVEALGIDESNPLVRGALSKISGVEPQKLSAIAIGSFVYATLFAIEGVGLWLEKRWGEWFTIFITVSFIPIELYEIGKHATAPKIVTLVLNVAVLVYLVIRIRWERKPSVRLKKAFGSPHAFVRFVTGQE